MESDRAFFITLIKITPKCTILQHTYIDEIILFFKGKVVFRQYIHKKHKRFGKRIHKLCDCLDKTYCMKAVRKEASRCHCWCDNKHGTMLQLVEDVGHKLYMEIILHFPIFLTNFATFHMLLWNIQYNRQIIPTYLTKHPQMKKGDTTRRVVGSVTSVWCKDKRYL